MAFLVLPPHSILMPTGIVPLSSALNGMVPPAGGVAVAAACRQG